LTSPSSIDVAMAFVARINDHDVAGLVALMTPGHKFTDSVGHVVAGRDKMKKGWTYYFQMFPDYAIEVTKAFAHANVVALFGQARGTLVVNGKLAKENLWEIPAAWKAVLENSLIADWQVYADNEAVRKIMSANSPLKSG